MTEQSNSAGTPQPQGDAARPDGQRPVRPVGTWVVAGFLLFATLVIWGLVSVIFQARS
jgi:hypothetical protein